MLARTSAGEGQKQRERESQAGSTLSTETYMELSPTTLRS